MYLRGLSGTHVHVENITMLLHASIEAFLLYDHWKLLQLENEMKQCVELCSIYSEMPNIMGVVECIALRIRNKSYIRSICWGLPIECTIYHGHSAAAAAIERSEIILTCLGYSLYPLEYLHTRWRLALLWYEAVLEPFILSMLTVSFICGGVVWWFWLPYVAVSCIIVPVALNIYSIFNLFCMSDMLQIFQLYFS